MAAIQWRHRISALPEQRRQNKDKRLRRRAYFTGNHGECPQWRTDSFSERVERFEYSLGESIGRKSRSLHQQPSFFAGKYLSAGEIFRAKTATGLLLNQRNDRTHDRRLERPSVCGRTAWPYPRRREGIRWENHPLRQPAQCQRHTNQPY